MTEFTNGGGSEETQRTILTGIAPRTWEHPADKAALNALRKMPLFDTVLRKLFGIFGEKPIRLAFQADAVKVGPNQFPRLNRLYEEVLETLGVEERYDLFVAQDPVVNAGAYGMDEPFIILNSAANALLDDREVSYILGHEVGHIVSGHVLYRTMMALLIQVAQIGFPIVGLAARGILIGLLEWSRKAELSCDRAGLLAVQDPEVVMGSMLKMAGGGRPEETSLAEFIDQAEAYRESEDVADSVFKILNLLGRTHPFWVLRVAEIRSWIEAGEYDRIIRGEYSRHGDPDEAYREDLRSAASAYAEGAKGLLDDMGEAAKKMGSSLLDTFRRDDS